MFYISSNFASLFGTRHLALRRSLTSGKRCIMKQQNFLCVDLTTKMKKSDLQVLDSRKGTLHRTEDDKFTFIEKGVPTYQSRPELRWHLIDRTKHGQVKYNSQHVMVQLYVPHDDYVNGRQLADILASEVETMGETLCEMQIGEEEAHA